MVQKHDRQRHVRGLKHVNVVKMAIFEGIQEGQINAAFQIAQSEGRPKNGRVFKNIQRLLAKNDIPGIKKILETEDHWPTRAMIIRNIALIQYRHQNTKIK